MEMIIPQRNSTYYSIGGLNENSLVIDAGGYMGDFTASLEIKCNVIIFEPQPDFYKHCKERFKDNPKVKVENSALSKVKGTSELYVRMDGTSFYKAWARSSDAVLVSTIRLGSYIKDIPKIDLLKLNIEGAEYDVIPDLDRSNQMKKIARILVQYHLIDDSLDRYWKCRRILSKTHKRTRGKFKWETWEKI